VTSLTNPATGHTVRTGGESVEFWQAAGYRGGEDAAAQEGKSYDGLKVAELKAEIESRNEGRDEADVLSTDGKKADLIAVLEADDK
jgi:hypothetical protein